jgi:hypothetical protein
MSLDRHSTFQKSNDKCQMLLSITVFFFSNIEVFNLWTFNNETTNSPVTSVKSQNKKEPVTQKHRSYKCKSRSTAACGSGLQLHLSRPLSISLASQYMKTCKTESVIGYRRDIRLCRCSVKSTICVTWVSGGNHCLLSSGVAHYSLVDRC